VSDTRAPSASPIRRVRSVVGSRIPRPVRRYLFAVAEDFSLREFVADRRADAVLVSFPKCGRTWLRVMVGSVLAELAGVPRERAFELGPIEGAPSFVPNIRVTHAGNPDWKRPFEVRYPVPWYQGKRVVFLARDPRDVVVSLYFHKTKRQRLYTRSLSQFIREPRGSLQTIIRFYNVWLRNRRNFDDWLLLRYEDLHRDPESQLAELLRFVGLDWTPSDLVRASVEASRFDRMRSAEASGTTANPRLKASDGSDPESYKTRKGVVGGYKSYLSDDDVSWIDDQLRHGLDPDYGY